MKWLKTSPLNLHRHIGGLEKQRLRKREFKTIHRHIGGLEIDKLNEYVIGIIHRHIGGLENDQNGNRS